MYKNVIGYHFHPTFKLKFYVLSCDFLQAEMRSLDLKKDSYWFPWFYRNYIVVVASELFNF